MVSKPKVRLSRALGVPIAETPKHITPRRQRRPGQHGYHRTVRKSLYGLQLLEKQKLASYYDIRDAQLRRYMRIAQTSHGQTSDTLQRLLETRLDNCIRRLKWARTIWQARQMVTHGHFLINGRKVDKPSINLKAGDVITVKPGNENFVKSCAEAAESTEMEVPQWFSVDKENLKAIFTRLPAFEEVRFPFELDYSKIIEFYTR